MDPIKTCLNPILSRPVLGIEACFLDSLEELGSRGQEDGKNCRLSGDRARVCRWLKSYKDNKGLARFELGFMLTLRGSKCLQKGVSGKSGVY